MKTALQGLKIGGVPEHFNLPWRLAIESGKLKEIGLDLHWSDMTGGTGQMIRGLETGSIDIAVVLTEGITKGILQGLNAKILQVYVASPLHWGIHVPYNSSIKSIKDIENKTFAISREGSGSHLMAYVIADQNGWDLQSLKFNVVGDIYGGLWALEKDRAQVFLWEKFTTSPYVEQKKCRCIDEVITPWPCFAIAVRNEIAEAHEELLWKMCKVVNNISAEIKQDPSTPRSISWRYNIKEEEAKKWLSETDWNYTGKDCSSEIKNVVDYLFNLKLLKEEEIKNWDTKLFLKR